MTDLLQEDGSTLLLLEDGVDNLELQDVITPYGVVTDMVVQTPDGPKEMLPRVRWNGTWSPGTYYNMQMVTDGNYQAIANKTTTDRPAPQPSGDTYYPTEGATWVDQSNNVTTITYENLYNIQSGFFFEYILLDVAAANVGYLHELTVFTDGVLSGRVTWTPETADPVTLNLGGVLIPSSTGTLQVVCKVTRSSGVGLGWAEDVGHWTGYSSPEISSAQGQLDSGGYTDTAYGIDILVTPATISEDWDITAVSGGAGGGGGGGTGTPSPLTTKGDIWSYSNTDARFPVSTTPGQVITVDTAEPFGFKWENIPYAPQGEVAFNYNYSDTITPVGIASGELRLDNTDLSLATKLYVSDVTNAGNDITVFLSEFVQSNYLTLYQTTPGNATVSYQITAGSTPVDGGTYWEYDLTFLFETAADAYTNGEPVQLIKVGNPADRLPEGGQIGQVMVKAGADPYNLDWGGSINFYDTDEIIDPFRIDCDGGSYTAASQENEEGRFTRSGSHDHFYDGPSIFPAGAYIPPLVKEAGIHTIDRSGNNFTGMGFLFNGQGTIRNVNTQAITYTPYVTLNSVTKYIADTTVCSVQRHVCLNSSPQFEVENGGTLNVSSIHQIATDIVKVNANINIQEWIMWRANIKPAADVDNEVTNFVGLCFTNSNVVDQTFISAAREAMILFDGVPGNIPSGTSWNMYQAGTGGDNYPGNPNRLGFLHLAEMEKVGVGDRNLIVGEDGLVKEGAPALSTVQTGWVQELAEEFIKVTGSTTPTSWVTVHTETLGTDEAVRGTYSHVAKRTDSKGFSYGERKYVVWEDSGSISIDDIELYEVGAGVAFAETRINLNGSDIEFQVRSVTGDWDWNVTIFNKDIL